MQLWVCALPREPGENIRVDYVVQIILHRLAELKLIADGFQISFPSQSCIQEVRIRALEAIIENGTYNSNQLENNLV